MKPTVTLSLEEYKIIEEQAEKFRKIQQSIRHLSPKYSFELNHLNNPMLVQQKIYKVYQGDTKRFTDAHFWLASVLEDIGVQIEEDT